MIYEYRCQECGAVFDVQATLAQKEDGLHPACPLCRSPVTVQRFASIGIMRDGSAGLPAAACVPDGRTGCC